MLTASVLSYHWHWKSASLLGAGFVFIVKGAFVLYVETFYTQHLPMYVTFHNISKMLLQSI